MNIEQHIILNFAEFNPEKIILFGSYAKGNWDEDSDIDVMIVYQTQKSI